eukprot:PLAT4768.1.p1 GENE.PLAT4768.1~~PLAT4768.1.p1  ORF type:complete len:158 (-),score=69.15 PLAT4768.1:29-502(-)
MLRCVLRATPRLAPAGRALSSASGSGMHEDFAPKRHVSEDGAEGWEEVKSAIESDIARAPAVLFMKGTRYAPMCGFSNQVVAILNYHGVEFHDVNVLQDAAVREGIKKYSDWPTIPQLYLGGEFVGGCDILTEMHNNGELPEVLAAAGIEPAESKSD